MKQRQLKSQLETESGNCFCIVLSKVLSLDYLSCPQIWNIEREKDREKENVGDRPAKCNDKKSDRQLEREIKDKGDIFSLEEQHENFVAAVGK